MPKIPHIDFSTVRDSQNINFVDGDFAVFSDVNQFPLYSYPERLDAAVMAICLQGSWRLEINLKECNMSPGSLMVTLPEQILQSIELSDDFSALFVVISKGFVDNIFPKLKDLLPFFFYLKEQPCINITAEDQNCIVEYYSLLLRKAIQHDNYYRKEISQGLMLAMFYDIYNIYRKYMPKVVAYENRKEEVFEQFLHTLNDSFRDERSVNYYANKLFLTPKHLSRVVKEVSGKTAGEWIDDFVILEAKALLKSSEKSIQEIAEGLHFANQSFFGKYFKHHTGLPPKEYRKK
ncbi:helix-turn-helix domain-containing protein [uncultured Bacteroides sp.]|uniref:helix-turn-helix domain-containing protein n=1 Tax=uncultured Bacteroides sp. TaxID=162156 RepID=UPI002AA833E2|nr:helix-turn-helix domain-containing protein [uncultured Bacteroides sp.]